MPLNYIHELAKHAFADITVDTWLQSKEITHYVPQKPALETDLERELVVQPPLFQAHIAWKSGYTPSKWLLENELDEVKARRQQFGIAWVDEKGDVQGGSETEMEERRKKAAPPRAGGKPDEVHERAATSRLMGICFSGGGIRSATFNLGVLQGLAELKLLRCFDYLSSVSGGGYIHQWLAAWISRESKDKTGKLDGFKEVNDKLTPLPDPGSPKSHPEPLRWLRRYSNYLTPEKGLFTADTWVVVATWLRNTILNEIILVAGLLFLVLVPHAFTLHKIRSVPWAAALIGVILYLFLLATVLIGKNLVRFRWPTAESRVLGQGGVQLGIVLPLVISALLFTLLFPLTSAFFFAVNLVVTFVVSLLLLLALTVTITFAGNAPLCYLQNHHLLAENIQTFGEFWRQPKCRVHLKAALAIAGFIAGAILASLAGAGWIVLTEHWIARLWSTAHPYWWKLTLVIDPTLILFGPLIAVLLLIGFLGRNFQDSRREWLARFGAWMGLYCLGWILFVGISLFGYPAVKWLAWKVSAGIPALVAWAGTTIAGLLAGKSTQTAGAKDDKAPSKFSVTEIIAVVAPYVFVVGLLLLLSALAEFLIRGHGPWYFLLVLIAAAVVCLLFAWRVNINEFSMHAFYRDRLARCYLGASNAERDPNPFTGFDDADANLAVSELRPTKGYYGPFPIFCTALNLTFGEDLAWQERKAASFAFTPLFSGYDVGWTAARSRDTGLRFNGFVQTEQYAYAKPGIHISTAAAISGAALSPNWGYHTNPATAFLLTVFNVRLGWWLANPRRLTEAGELLNKNRAGAVRARYPWPSPHFSLLYLINELLGQTNDTRQYVYLSDGGHFDNMGLYELVRRRCRYIVICDAEEDGKLAFEGIGMAIRKCRLDFGAEVSLDLRPLQHPADENSPAHCVVGTIRYPEDQGKKEEALGIVVYIKSSLTGDEPADVLNYKKEDPSFPHDSTLNQWFTESQFESYRRLGHHIAVATFAAASPESFCCISHEGRDKYFTNLKNIWTPFTPEMQQRSADHSRTYGEMLQKIRVDADLPGLFDMLFDRSAKAKVWKTTTNKFDYAVGVSSQLIEFMFMIYLQLKLVYPENLNHPFAQGWMDIFRSWATIDVIQEGWAKYGRGYRQSFQIFAHKEIKLPPLT